jgi:dTDP-4-amino-4,6-dideoxygalactose transaminase
VFGSIAKKLASFRTSPLPFHKCLWQPQDIVAANDCLDIARAKFETALRDYLAIESSTSVNLVGSGRGALGLGLAALAQTMPARKKVIIPTYCCAAVVPPVIESGLIPVFIDTGPELVSTADQYLAAMADNVLAVLIVNLCGKRLTDADRGKVLQQARAFSIVSIEDNCHYLVPMSQQPRPDMELLSFGFGKVLSATAGGALISRVAQSAIDAERIRYKVEPVQAAETRLRSFLAKFGATPSSAPSDEELQAARMQYGLVLMNDFDAALALSQLPRLDGHIRRQVAIGRRLFKTLQRHPQMFAGQTPDNNIFTRVPVILRDVDAFNQFWGHMDTERKIGLEGMYVPLHLKFSDFHSGPALPQAEDAYRRVFNIPGRTNLGILDVARIQLALNDFAATAQ